MFYFLTRTYLSSDLAVCERRPSFIIVIVITPPPPQPPTVFL